MVLIFTRQPDIQIDINTIPQILSIKGNVFVLEFIINQYPGHFVCLSLSDGLFIKYNCLSKNVLIFKEKEKINPQLLFYVRK